MTKIKNCPRCKGQPDAHRDPYKANGPYKCFKIECCGICIIGISKEATIKDWNTRVVSLEED